MKKQIIEKIESLVKLNGGKLFLFENKEYLYVNGERCSGFYDEDNQSLHIACYKRSFEEWLGVLVHEYAHLLQHRQNSRAWAAWKKNCTLDIDDWLMDRTINPSPKIIDKIYKATILLEREAEKIALDLIEELDLPLKKKDYAKNANCYLMFYYWSKAHRLWYKTAPYKIPELVEKMPSRLLTIKELERNFHKFDYSDCFLRKDDVK